MALLKDNNPVTADGDYAFSVTAGKEYAISMNGTFGGGAFSVQFDYTNDDSGSYQTIPSGSITSNSSFIFYAHSRTMNINVAGATSPSVNVRITEVING